jgi:hypothetical protein
MALPDDLNKLAAQDVVYLTRRIMGLGLTEVFRGRLRQALSGNWVFNASTGQNGVVGFVLGNVGQNLWNSAETPAGGIQIVITFQLAPVAGVTIIEVINLTSVIPTDFTD